MTLRIHAPNPIRVGETANVLVTSDNPGVVSLAYGAGLTGPATATIEGTRTYGNMGQGGDYVARVGAEGNARMDRTWLLRVDWNAVQCGNNATAGAYIAYPILASMRMDSTNRLNWFLFASVYNANGSAPNRSIRLALSQNSGTNPVVAVGTLVSGDLALAGVRRYAVTITGTTVAIYTDARATVANNTVSGIIGTMGGSEALVWQSGVECSKIARVASSAELDAWFADGTIPADDREFMFMGGHEIDPAAPVIWDTSGNVTPLDLTATQITNRQAPGMSASYTDDPGDPVVPYAIVPVTAVATTDTTIDATRPRQGVPARASEAERIETADQCTVTVEAALPPCFEIGPDVTGTAARFPALRRLTVFSQTDGAVTLASDNAKVLVPASVNVVDGFATFDVSISGAVSGVTLTATQDGETATCDVDLAFGVHAVPEMGPNDTLQLFPEWLWTEPHTQGIAAVMDDRRAAFVSDLDHLLIYDFANQTSAMLDLVAEMFAIYGWNKAAGTTEKVAFLESSLKILRKSGTHYAVKEAIRLVCDAAKIESITIIEGTGGTVYDGTWTYDGSVLYDSHFSWARFDVEIYTSDIPYFSDEIKTVITSMINHYKPASRWLEKLRIKGIV